MKVRILDSCEMNSLRHSIFSQFEDTNKNYFPCVIGVQSKEVKETGKENQ